MIGLYIGVICVIYGSCIFVHLVGTRPGDKIPPPAHVVACTMIMACMYFLVYAGVQFSRAWTQFTGSKFTKFENSMTIAANAKNFAPMLSVVVIGARMRALQMDPVNGAPNSELRTASSRAHMPQTWCWSGEQSSGSTPDSWTFSHHGLHLCWLPLRHELLTESGRAQM